MYSFFSRPPFYKTDTKSVQHLNLLQEFQFFIMTWSNAQKPQFFLYSTATVLYSPNILAPVSLSPPNTQFPLIGQLTHA